MKKHILLILLSSAFALCAYSAIDISACAGSTMVLYNTSTGSLSTQWQLSNNGGVTFSNIAGATDTTYTFTAVAADSGYEYRYIYTTAGGADTGQAVIVSVLPLSSDTIPASVCPGQGYTLGTQTYTNPGTYTQTIYGGAANGCDSLLVLVLTVASGLSDSATVSGPVCTAWQTGVNYQWISCSTGQPINNATSQSYTATANGSYQCIVFNNTCSDTTTCVTVTDAGIDGISPYQFSLYPDPSSGIFSVENNYNGATTIHILNMLGEEMKTFSMNAAKAQFDISSLAAGIYEVQISSGGQTLKVLKIVRN